MLDTLVSSAKELCEADNAFLFHYEGTTFSWGADCGFSPEYKEYMQRQLPQLRPERGTLIGRVVLEQTTVHIPDYLADPEGTWFEAQRVGQQRTLLGVPLQRDGALIGVLGMGRDTVRPFGASQIELINELCRSSRHRHRARVAQRTKAIVRAADGHVAGASGH